MQTLVLQSWRSGCDGDQLHPRSRMPEGPCPDRSRGGRDPAVSAGRAVCRRPARACVGSRARRERQAGRRRLRQLELSPEEDEAIQVALGRGADQRSMGTVAPGGVC
jgi:hypothetical protein